jgi:hypothetical protein
MFIGRRREPRSDSLQIDPQKDRWPDDGRRECIDANPDELEHKRNKQAGRVKLRVGNRLPAGLPFVGATDAERISTASPTGMRSSGTESRRPGLGQ